MKRQTKLYGLAGVLLLLASVAVMLLPRQEPASVTETPDGSRPAHRSPRNPEAGKSRGPADFSSLVRRMNNGDFPQLTLGEIENYLNSRNRSAQSLLSAFRLSDNEAYLKEALEKFPDNPQVLLTSLHLADDPATRLQILESLKRADPENAIANFLAARALFDLGKDDEAFQELLGAEGKMFQDFTVDFLQNDEEAYLAAGLSPIEAKMTSLSSMSKQATMQTGGNLKKLDGLRERFEANGDVSAADSVRAVQYEMGRQIQESGMVIDLMVGLQYEKRSLEGIDTEDALARTEDIDRRSQVLQDVSRAYGLMDTSTVPESDWLLFFDRAKLFGEKAAIDWLLEKYPEPPEP